MSIPKLPEIPSFASVPQKKVHHEFCQRAIYIFLSKFICKGDCNDKCRENLITTHESTCHEKLESVLKILDRIGNMWIEAVKTNQITSTEIDKYALIGDMVGTVLNTIVSTYFFGPVFTLMEFEVLTRIRELIGFQNPDDGDGLFLPGAGFGTINAVRMAIHHNNNKLKFEGMSTGKDNNENFCVFVSSNYYKNARNACYVNGISRSSCISVPVNDSTGTMDVTKLNASIKHSLSIGLTPLMVIATLGSKDKPKFDHLREISEVALDYNIWLHVEGGFGGPAIFSENLRQELLEGIQHADSVLIGMETLLAAPYCTTLLVTPHKDLCLDTFGLGDRVLFKNSTLYESSFDRGDGSLQTTRRPDVLKVWLMWKAYGTSGLGRKVEEALWNKYQILHSMTKTESADSIGSNSSQLQKIHDDLPDCQLFRLIFETLQGDAFYAENSRELSPVHFLKPEELLNNFNFSLEIEGIQNKTDVLPILQKIMNYSNRITHPHYIFQLNNSGLDIVGMMGDFWSAVTSCSMESYEESFLYGRMEQEVFSELRRLVGYSNEEHFEKNFQPMRTNGYGLVCPGGSISIITAVYIAMQRLQPIADRKTLVVFISKNAHYAFKKACLVFGIGVNNCITVEVDSNGKMSPNALRKAITNTLDENKIPFFVGLTAGTTIQGCFDDIEAVSKITQEFGLWLHIDGSFGGPIIFSEKYKKLHLKGLEKSDSFNLNPHKWLGIPQECSILLLKTPGTIQKAFGDFGHSDEFGNYSGLQLDRRQNILKFWLSWKSQYGFEKWEQHVEYTMDLKDFLVRELTLNSQRRNFRIWKEDFETPGVSFQYIPNCLLGEDSTDPLIQEKLGHVTESLSSKLILEGIMAVGVYRDNGSVPLLRFVLINSGITREDIIFLLNQVHKYGANMQF